MNEALLGIQILSIFFALFMMYLIRLHHRRGNLGVREYLMWLCCWCVFIVFALFPGVLTPVITTLKIVRVLDLLMEMAFKILTYLAFSDHMAVRDLYRKIDSLISTKAIKTATKRSVKSVREFK